MNQQSTNDTTQNNNNENESNNPYEYDLLNIMTTQNKMLTQLKLDLDEAKHHLNKLQDLRTEAEIIFQEATRLLEEIRSLLFPLQGENPHD